jgi:hypothetical protein
VCFAPFLSKVGGVEADDLKKVVVEDYANEASTDQADTTYYRLPLPGFAPGEAPNWDVLEPIDYVAFENTYLVSTKKQMQTQDFIQEDYGDGLEFITNILPEVATVLVSSSVLTRWTRPYPGDGQLDHYDELIDRAKDMQWRVENGTYDQYDDERGREWYTKGENREGVDGAQCAEGWRRTPPRYDDKEGKEGEAGEAGGEGEAGEEQR